MAYTAPSDMHVPGDAGHTTDHNNIADIVTGVADGMIVFDGFLSTVTNPQAATMARRNVTTVQTATGFATGVLAVTAIGLPLGMVVSSCTFQTGATAKSGGTHGWYVLMDSNRNELAITADQTDPATVWGATNTPYTLNFAAPILTTYGGVYYVGVMVAAATTMPTFVGSAASVAGAFAGAPIMGGTSDTGLTTPPAIPHQFGAITAQGNCNFYVTLA
jgi:hypothetical protein